MKYEYIYIIFWNYKTYTAFKLINKKLWIIVSIISAHHII